MGGEPVIVIHGIGTRNRAKFEAAVERLNVDLGGDRRLIPVYWGDIGRPAEEIEPVLPYVDWLPEAKREFSGGATARRGREVLERLKEAFGRRDLDAASSILSESWKHYGKISQRALVGAVYNVFRKYYLTAGAEFIGDVLFYQRRYERVYARIWETIMREAPGYGLAERPISAIAHSLGGVMLFDLAVAGYPPLHIDRFFTCGSQASFFHVIGCSPPALQAYEPGKATKLPGTIRAWTNFFVPLDPWAFVAAPVFRLSDGTAPEDVEVIAGEGRDRLFRHAVEHYLGHPVVLDRVRRSLAAT